MLMAKWSRRKWIFFFIFNAFSNNYYITPFQINLNFPCVTITVAVQHDHKHFLSPSFHESVTIPVQVSGDDRILTNVTMKEARNAK